MRLLAVTSLLIFAFHSALASDISIAWNPVRPIVLGIKEADAYGANIAQGQSSVAIYGTITNNTAGVVSYGGANLYYLGHEAYHDKYGVVGGAPSSLDGWWLQPGEARTGVIAFAFLIPFNNPSNDHLIGQYDWGFSESYGHNGIGYSAVTILFRDSGGVNLSSDTIYFRTSVQPVPEPTTCVAFAIGGLALRSRKNSR